jgi:hypothetical protein
MNKQKEKESQQYLAGERLSYKDVVEILNLIDSTSGQTISLELPDLKLELVKR